MTPEQSISDAVAKNGYRVLSISDHKPPFAYSVGLMFSQRHPELVIFGLREAGPDILRGIVKLIREGKRFDAPGEYDVLGVIRVATRPVHPTHHELYLRVCDGLLSRTRSARRTASGASVLAGQAGAVSLYARLRRANMESAAAA